ncbi:MAG: phosphate acyltransferase, partial [Planctomycetota bacterium]
VFVGLSKGGILDADMVRSMTRDPIIFALANPDPEISYPDARAARDDVIVGTGRSDYPNQINNVLGFPFLFRGALDVRATAINEEMKLAAVEALARLAKEDVPEVVSEAYGNEAFQFGREYLIPKPLDPRALVEVSSSVARAAMESGVARAPVDLGEYRGRLEHLLGRSSQIVVSSIRSARRGRRCRIAFPEGEDPEILQAASRVIAEGVGVPVLLGRSKVIEEQIREYGFDWSEDRYEVVDVNRDPRRERFAEALYALRKYKGLREEEAHALSFDPTHFAIMMLHEGEVECCLSGVNSDYAESLRPALQILRVEDWLTKCSGLYILSVEDRVYYFADTTVNIDPTPKQLAEIAICAAEAAQRFGSQPRVAMLSFANASESKHPRVQKIQKAVEIARSRYPDLDVVGGIQADAAVDMAIRRNVCPEIDGENYANVLVFPDLDAANIACKLMTSIAGAEGIGPIVLGLRKAMNVIERGASAEEIFRLAAITVVEAQARLFD